MRRSSMNLARSQATCSKGLTWSLLTLPPPWSSYIATTSKSSIKVICSHLLELFDIVKGIYVLVVTCDLMVVFPRLEQQIFCLPCRSKFRFYYCLRIENRSIDWSKQTLADKAVIADAAYFLQYPTANYGTSLLSLSRFGLLISFRCS